MIERLWRSMKYECVYLHAFETGGEAKAGIERWVTFYNEHRPHSRLDDRTPDEAYFQKPRGIPENDRPAGSGMNIKPFHLKIAANLFRSWGPPLFSFR